MAGKMDGAGVWPNCVTRLRNNSTSRSPQLSVRNGRTPFSVLRAPCSVQMNAMHAELHKQARSQWDREVPAAEPVPATVPWFLGSLAPGHKGQGTRHLGRIWPLAPTKANPLLR